MVSETIKQLFPPGSLPENDHKARLLIDSVAKEFDRVLHTLSALVESIPDKEEEGLLTDRWRKITGAQVPVSRLVSKGFLAGPGLYVSNTTDHFSSIADVEISASPNHITVTKIKNIRISIRAGARICGALATFDRDEDTVDTFERMRHAHVKMTYKESKHA